MARNARLAGCALVVLAGAGCPPEDEPVVTDASAADGAGGGRTMCLRSSFRVYVQLVSIVP